MRIDTRTRWQERVGVHGYGDAKYRIVFLFGKEDIREAIIKGEIALMEAPKDD